MNISFERYLPDNASNSKQIVSRVKLHSRKIINSNYVRTQLHKIIVQTNLTKDNFIQGSNNTKSFRVKTFGATLDSNGTERINKEINGDNNTALTQSY